MRDRRAAVRRRRLARLAGVALLATGFTAGCTSDPSDDGSPAPTGGPSPTPVSELDLATVSPVRAPFCDALDETAVADVLDGPPEVNDSYRSGQRTKLAPRLHDVANEFSCYFERGSAREVRTARVWLFAQAVGRQQARRLVKERRADERCSAAGELSFGKPGLVQSCSTRTRQRVTAVGLFGDGWLSCQTTAPVVLPEAELLEKAQRWCAEVALSTAGR